MRYVAFLRAVNVGGRTVKMQDLKAAFETLPVTDVHTFIASGNVIFDARAGDTASLERQAEAALKKVFGIQIDVFVRSLDELPRIAECGPYQDIAASGKGGTVYVGFLRRAPGPELEVKLKSASTASDEYSIRDREVLWLHRADAADRLGQGPPLEKGMSATFRNSRTVRRIADKFLTRSGPAPPRARAR